jgi:ATP-dependent DNA helicase RecQ
VIFHDSTLQEMAQQRPASKDELRRISGIGDKKLSEYGESFLAVVAGESEAKNRIDNEQAGMGSYVERP